MTNLSPATKPLSQPVDLVEAERFCPGCGDCWPITPEFWNKSSIRNDGLQRLCKACQVDSETGNVCFLVPDAPSKACSGCNIHKPLTIHFWHCSPDKKDGFATKCKACAKKVRDARRANPRVVVEPTRFRKKSHTVYKKCHACDETKPLVRRYWHRCSSKKDGFSSQCKACVNAHEAVSRHFPAGTLPKKAPVKRKLVEGALSKNCNACHQDKLLTVDFWYKSTSASDGFMRICKVCDSAAQKARAQKRREQKAQLEEDNNGTQSR